MSLSETTQPDYASGAAALSVLLAAMILPLSFTGGVITTPAISEELGGSPLSLAWLTNGFMLTFGSTLLAAGVTADLTGRKNVFIAGLMFFFFSCVLVCFAGNTPLIGVFRTVQGVAAAMTLAGGSAMLAQLFDGPPRTRVFGILGTMFGAGLAFGPLVTGMIIGQFGWRWVYAFFALFAAVTAVMGMIFLPPAASVVGAKPDVKGLTLFSACLVFFTVALLLVPEQGVTSWPVLALFVAALLAARLFIIRCRKADNPVFELSLLRYPRFVGVLILPLATCCCYVVLLILLPLRFTGGEAFSATKSALYLMALTVPVLLLPTVAALLTRWFRPGSLSAFGLVVSAIGLLLLGQALQSDNRLLLVASMLLTGAGAALPWGLMDGLAVSGVPVEKAGMAAGLFNTVRVAGEGVTLVIVMAFLAAVNHFNLDATLTNQTAQVMTEAATWLGNGNLQQAQKLLPDVSPQLLRHSYNQAYTLLFDALALITFVSALLVWKTLNSKTEKDRARLR